MDLEDGLVDAVYRAGSQDDLYTRDVLLDALFWIRRYRWANRNRLRLRTKRGDTTYV